MTTGLDTAQSLRLLQRFLSHHSMLSLADHSLPLGEAVGQNPPPCEGQATLRCVPEWVGWRQGLLEWWDISPAALVWPLVALAREKRSAARRSAHSSRSCIVTFAFRSSWLFKLFCASSTVNYLRICKPRLFAWLFIYRRSKVNTYMALHCTCVHVLILHVHVYVS